ncbi:MAG TPA: NAD-dependent protein deacylase, partial [Candidatus Omnitrophica bacterium]|nr:NAD-dependent protein deacylase [Candidatus Omnitrophota bacterium]
LALAEMEIEGYLKSIITQNIDNLHQKAGSRDVIELHGNIFRWYCTQCSRVRILSEEELRDFIHQLKEKRGRVGIIRCFRDFSQCECGERLRPSVVLFGEVLPQAEFERAEQQVHKCDLLLLIGTSAIVSPASNLPYEAKRKDATLVEINTEQTQLTTMCDFSFQEKAGKVLHEIVRFLL